LCVVRALGRRLVAGGDPREPDRERVADARVARASTVEVENKRDLQSTQHEFYKLGAGDPQPVSAQNGKNSGDLLDEIVKKLPAEQDDETATTFALR